MVTLSQILTQWPWTNNAIQSLSDKEILTHRISVEEASTSFRATLLPCLPGYAYVGYRIVCVDPNATVNEVSLHYGGNGRCIFGSITDNQCRSERDWTLFNFPIVRRLCMMDNEKINLYVDFDRTVWGKVEFLAQRFDDLLEEDDQIVYNYRPNNNFPPECGGWIVDREGPVQWMRDAYREAQYPNAKFIYPLRGSDDNNVI